MHEVIAANLEKHHQFRSKFLSDSRDIVVYLPPGYAESGDTRYPVLYLHDGQNLFDPATAFGGTDWRVHQTADELILTGQIQPLIIVGIYNTGPARLQEYTHVRDRRGQGGLARLYGKAIISEIKPFIDSRYRSLPGPSDTALGGSSLGGLVTLYLGLRNPQVFSRLIVMSPSVWWKSRHILEHVARLKPTHNQKIWLDVGTAEGSRPEQTVQDVEALRDALIDKGWRLGDNLAFVKDEGAGHNEGAWGVRMRSALNFLFQPDAAL